MDLGPHIATLFDCLVNKSTLTATKIDYLLESKLLVQMSISTTNKNSQALYKHFYVVASHFILNGANGFKEILWTVSLFVLFVAKAKNTLQNKT